MKNRSFKSLIEEINKKKVEDERAFGPGNAGEKAFYDLHKKEDHSHPAENSDEKLNARGTKQDTSKENPPKDKTSLIKQGTSILKDQSGFKNKQTPSNKNDKRGGDLNLIIGKSNIKPIKEESTTGSEPGLRFKSIATMVAKAAGSRVSELDEVLSKDATAGDYIDDFVHSKNPKFDGDSKEQRTKRALGAYYGRNK